MVWAVSTLHSPLRPAAAGEEGWLGEAQSASTPCPFLALPSSSPLAPAARTCERACCCCEPRSDRPRLAAPFPPLLPAAHAPGMRAAPPCAPTNNWVGGWEKVNESWRGRP